MYDIGTLGGNRSNLEEDFLIILYIFIYFF